MEASEERVDRATSIAPTPRLPIGMRFIEYAEVRVVTGQEVGNVIEAADQVSGRRSKCRPAWPRRRIAVITRRSEHDCVGVPCRGERPATQEICDALQDKAYHRPPAVSIAEGVGKETLLDECSRRPSERLDLAPRT